MKEHPILFNGEMVRAILDGRKTMTRRVMKCAIWKDIEIPNPAAPYHYGKVSTARPCPYGQPGDRLWVRETWCPQINIFGIGLEDRVPFYRAADGKELPTCHKWRASFHMPRWASRITLEIVSVRVEQVQEINDTDAKAEGVQAVIGKKIHGWTPHCLEFSLLWDSINAKRGYGWGANPWVWVIEFKRMEGK